MIMKFNGPIIFVLNELNEIMDDALKNCILFS